MKKNNKFAEIVFFLIFFAFFYINTVTLKDGHNWGDDFGQYLIHAQNIAQNLPYASRLNLDQWITYLPGYPFLLSLIIKISGINLKLCKFFNVVFWYLSILALPFLFQKGLGNRIQAFFISTVFITSPFFFMFKQSVLSDIPFTFFVILSFLFYWAYRESLSGKAPPVSWGLFLLAMLGMCLASLIRYTGFLLFISIFIYSIYVKDKSSRLIVIFFSMLCLVAIQRRFGTSVFAHAHELSVHRGLWDYGKLFVRNAAYNVAAGIVFFLPNITFLNTPSYSFFMPAVPLLTPVLLGAFVWHFILKFKENTLLLEDIFFLIYIIGLCFWPFYEGPRYLLPIIWWIPVIFIEIAKRITAFFKKNLNLPIFFAAGMFILIIFNAVSIRNNFSFNDDQVYKPETVELVNWMEKNVLPDEHFMFTFPRALGLLTKRQGVRFWYTPERPDLLPAAIEKYNITYLILFQGDVRVMNFIHGQDSFTAAEVWKNTDFIIYKVKLQKKIKLI